ncbi:MAG: phenylalanine--tRNA ligase subunit alpha [Rickettsiaceae bacterium H1]|nr:phenylalanine--tRNA ligase subunit alpha [Rickettsiaceae bacterium H1]
MQKVEKILNNIESVSSIAELESLRVFYLGKKGVITGYFTDLKKCNSLEKKKELGKELNKLRDKVITAIEGKKKSLAKKQQEEKLKEETIDITLPVRPNSQGKKHPISQIIEEVVGIFSSLGFEKVSGNEIDDEFHIFDALNTPSHHPARQMQDSFYLTSGLMLRPHTSSVQIHTMQKGNPPFKIIAPGRVYRRDLDATHTPMFHQIEGLYIDKDIGMSHLKFCITYFIEKFFGKIESRFRPSFFPFTEPSAEVDIKDNNGNWVEILGCGIVHKNVLTSVELDCAKHQGFAFGIGIERLTMLKHNIADLRLLFENNINWLKAYGSSVFSE